MRIRDFCPPVLLAPLRAIAPSAVRYSGPYASWQDAARRAIGYDSDIILERVVAATRKVVAGEAAFERDSVLFDEVEQPFQLLAPLLRVAAEDGARLSVLDFGGSLGSTYRQCRKFLGRIALAWNVIEQPKFVQAGQREFETDELKFYERASDVPAARRPTALLFSGSLQYLDAPFEVLEAIAALPGAVLIIDRTPFRDGKESFACVQKVPRRIYPASYPLWVLGRERLLSALAPQWQVAASFATPEGTAWSSSGWTFTYGGLIFQRAV